MKYFASLLIIPLLYALPLGQSNSIHIQLSKLGGGIAPAKFIVEDELGRRTGRDPIADTTIREIPGAHYGSEGLDDHESGGPGDLWRVFDIWDSAAKGTYTIKVIGTSADSFHLNIQISRIGVGVKAAIFNFFGLASPGQVTEYRIYYDPDPTKTLTAELITPTENILSVPAEFATTQAAVDASQPGDIIEVNPGFYNELVNITGKDSISVRTTSSIDGVICKGFLLKQSHQVTVKGFVVDASGTSDHGIVLMGGNNQNSDLTLEANEIKNAGSNFSGVSVARGNPRTRIVNNRIHSNGRNGIRIIDATGGPHYLVNNTIVQNGWNGVDVARQHVIYLVNNILSFNGTKPGSTGGRYGVLREAMTGPGAAADITLLSNLIVGNHGNVTSSSSQDLGNYVQTLDATDSGNLTTSGAEGSGVSASPTAIFADIFVSQTPLDLHLKASSVAIDRGRNSYNPPEATAGAIPPNDFESENRPKGAAVDLGADEGP